MTIEKLKQYAPRLTDAFFAAALLLFAFYVNRSIRIEGLYMDDLYMWSCYGEQSLLEFVFPIGTSTRFRPVYWLATYLQMAIIGTHVNWFVPFNILCNTLAAWLIYLFGKKLSGCPVLAFGTGLCYLTSRFAYYQIGQALGLMETMALFLAILILYLLWRVLNAPREQTGSETYAKGEVFWKKIAPHAESPLAVFQTERPFSLSLVKSCEGSFGLALVLYFLIVFVHERFLSLLPLFYLVLICRTMRQPKTYRRAFLRETRWLWLSPLLVFLLIVLIRRLCIGTAIPAGTGGTEVTETFSVREAISFALSQVYYLFGLNAGPEHLCGLPWEQTPVMIKALVKLSVLVLGVISAMYGLTMLLLLSSKKKADRERFTESLCNALLFLLFIALCIGCSSVTIRVEMRWIYVSYAAALLFLVYMIRIVKEVYEEACREEKQDAGDLGTVPTVGKEPELPRALTKEEEALLRREQQGNIFRRSSASFIDQIMRPRVVYGILVLLFAGYCALSVRTNVFYRGYFDKLYFWPNQLRMNSLAEETIGRYGREYVFGSDVYILQNSYEMSRFYADTFFKPFDPEKKAEGTTVHFIESIDEIPENVLQDGKLIVLKEEPEQNAYRDVTEETRQKRGIEEKPEEDV